MAGRFSRAAWMVMVLSLVSLSFAGCAGDSGTEPAASDAGGSADGGHGDGHDHSGHNHPAHGPHDGHILETSGNLHAEWTHSDDGKITVYILDAAATGDHPIEAESVAIETSIEGGESKTYTLNAMGEQPASAFEIVDTQLLAVLKVAGHEGAKATLKFSADGSEVTADISHKDDGHNH